ncbi:TonB-dependent siderophore receptor [Falsirhodobacter deserti]|uniref:TonB-dependent siderophore receptor n=1 Tax=Falsirhodobacter deserti TaxID=1365611 RepID=UPI000FE3989A|nr:TonB-dependent siderophore receptor [Falsirhodobacter deserti]
MQNHTPSGFHERRRAGSLLALLTLGTAICPAASYAQDVTTLPEIVVNATSDETNIVATDTTAGSKMQTDVLDTSASISVITAKEIATRNADTMEKVLAYSAGVLVNEYGGGDDRYDYVRIRGFDEMSLGSYRDGLPVRGFGWTFGRREIYGLERVEVLKGSNSSLFGMNAPGGLVNAVTKTPKPYRFGEVYTTLGDDHVEVGTDFGDVLDPAGVWSYRVTAKTQDASLGYDYSNDDRAYLAGALTYRPSDATELTVMLDHNDREGTPGASSAPLDAGIDPKTFLGEPDFNKFDTTERSYGYAFRRDFGRGVTFRQTARYSNLDLTYESIYGATEDPADDRTAFAIYGKNKQFAIDNQLEFDATFGSVQSRTLAGFEYSWMHLKENRLFGSATGIDIHDPSYCGRACIKLSDAGYSDQSPRLYARSVYLQQELTFADRWILTFGGRSDNIHVTMGYPETGAQDDRDYNAFTKRIGLTYKIDPSMSVYANYSESFEPDLWDLSADPREGTQYEVGFKYRPLDTDLMFSAALFDLTQTNVTTTLNNIPMQVGEVNVQGAEMEAKAELNDRFSLTAAWSYWNAEITEDAVNKGNRPAFTPRNTVSLWGDYTFPRQGARGETMVGLGLRYVSSAYPDNANTRRIGGHTTIDAAVSYQLAQNVALQANVSNLLDKRYVSATDTTGAGWYGDGRKVTATLKYTW